jgi:hypothetical protein
MVFPIHLQGYDQNIESPWHNYYRKILCSTSGLFSFCLSSHMENYEQANFCTFIVANSILHNKRFKLVQLDLIQTHHARFQAPIKASRYRRHILLAHLHKTIIQKSLYFQKKLGAKEIHTSSSSLPSKFCNMVSLFWLLMLLFLWYSSHSSQH